MDQDESLLVMEEPKQIIDQDGTIRWVSGDDFHRIGGPAIICPNGDQSWWQYGQLHREDGPAREYRYIHNVSTIDRYDPPLIDWWIRGKKVNCKTQKEFEQLMRMKAFW
jgi:hypothetical protein